MSRGRQRLSVSVRRRGWRASTRPSRPTAYGRHPELHVLRVPSCLEFKVSVSAKQLRIPEIKTHAASQSFRASHRMAWMLKQLNLELRQILGSADTSTKSDKARKGPRGLKKLDCLAKPRRGNTSSELLQYEKSLPAFGLRRLGFEGVRDRFRRSKRLALLRNSAARASTRLAAFARAGVSCPQGCLSSGTWNLSQGASRVSSC